MTTDLLMLVWSAVLCVVLFLPYVLSRITTWGLIDTVGYPANPPALPAWAQRAYRAHLNMVENLVPFTALVFVAHQVGAVNATVALGAQIFFWSRVVHAVVFIAGIPWVRTLAFTGGVVGMVIILLQILAK
jgi:uncharacterized MAPEG superfamily protein